MKKFLIALVAIAFVCSSVSATDPTYSTTSEFREVINTFDGSAVEFVDAMKQSCLSAVVENMPNEGVISASLKSTRSSLFGPKYLECKIKYKQVSRWPRWFARFFGGRTTTRTLWKVYHIDLTQEQYSNNPEPGEYWRFYNYFNDRAVRDYGIEFPVPN